MARRRKRREIKWGAVLWLLVLVNIAAGVMYSPMTSATRIKVVGARAQDKDRIVEHLKGLRDKPMMKVKKMELEEQLMRRPDVEKAEYSQNLFGSARLVIAYYEAVAILKGTGNIVLTDAGSLCAVPVVPEGLPTLEVFEQALHPVFALSAGWEMRNVADVCKRAAGNSLIKDLVVSVDRNGSVCLNSGDTGRVTLGMPEKLDEKFQKLDEVLEREPNLLLQKKDLVLVAPSRPVVRPLGAAK